MTSQHLNGVRSSSSTSNFQQVYIVAAARTPVGSFNGALKKLTAPQLGACAVKGALEKAGVKAEQVEEIYMGNVLTANVGQAPARQVALGVGCPESTEATTINKVCASGMKAISLAAQSIQLGQRNVMVAGGMESMSNAPYYVQRGLSYGHQEMTDSIIKDGLWDVYDQIHMGSCTEQLAKKFDISRQDQDEHAIESYKRAAEAWKTGQFDQEVVPVTIPSPKGDIVVKEDEEYKNVKVDKIPSLRTVFKKQDGTITAANASGLNDGASAVVLASQSTVDEFGLKPLARIISFADAACAPVDFGIAPSKSLPIALERAGIKMEDLAKIEINQAFSAVSLANAKILKLDPAKTDVLGGAVAHGHAIGSSGSRIVVTLAHLLKSGEYGAAAVCNGGGGSSAIVIQRV